MLNHCVYRWETIKNGSSAFHEMSLDVILNLCLSLSVCVCLYSRQFKLVDEGRDSKGGQDRYRHFEKCCKCQPHCMPFCPWSPGFCFSLWVFAFPKVATTLVSHHFAFYSVYWGE